MKLNEINIYDLHADPKSLNHDDAQAEVPELLWMHLIKKFKLAELTPHFFDMSIVAAHEFAKHEDVWMKDAKYAFLYARSVLNSRFKKGEKTIATDAEYSYRYARHVLKGPFKLGERTIEKDKYYSSLYNNFLFHLIHVNPK